MSDDFEDDNIGTGAKGKRGELIVISQLLQKGLQIYLPMVDMGIDCIVDLGDGNYKEVQIKYREKQPIFTAREFKPRPKRFIVCWYVDAKGESDYWVVPSKAFCDAARKTKAKKRTYLQLSIGKEGSKIYSQLAPYHHTFSYLLQGASSEVKQEVRHATRTRYRTDHLPRTIIAKSILEVLASQAEGEYLSTAQIITEVEDEESGNFTDDDWAKVGNGIPRWEQNIRSLIYGRLSDNGWIEAVSPNQWVITKKGRDVLQSKSLDEEKSG